MSDNSRERIRSVLRVLSDVDDSSDDPFSVSQRTRRSFKSLDRGLKAFLKSSNLPGLEYRLRLAGYNSLTDLLDADIDALCAHGFTPIMARRLLRALEEYVIGNLGRGEGDSPLPFQLVRKGQKITSDPTERMKALPTYGKQNVKRQRFILPKMGKKRTSAKGNKGKPPNPVAQKRPISYVRLMSEENLPSEPIFRNVLPVAAEGGQESRGSGDEGAMEEGLGEELAVSIEAGIEAGMDAEEEITTQPAEVTREASPATTTTTTTTTSSSLETRATGDQSPLPSIPVSGRRPQGVSDWRRSMPVFQEFYMPDEIDMGERWTTSDEMERGLKRCSSVPADFRYHPSNAGGVAATPSSQAGVHQPWCMLVRSYSSPASLAAPPSQIESTLIKLSTSQELSVIESSLRQLCSLVKGSEVSRAEVRERGGMEVIVDLLVSLCTHPRVVSSCFKLLKFLTRDVVLEDVVPVESISAVLQGMDCHPTSEHTLMQGCLALGNIGRAVPSLCEQLMSDRALPTLAVVMETFPDSPSLQVSVISVVAVGLGCCREGRLRLLSHHGWLLDLVLRAMEGFPQHSQLQEYACSFLALLMAEVAVEMESGVVQLMVERVCIAVATHGQDPQIAVWACKALASAASNAALGDGKLCGRGCDLVAEMLSEFPRDPAVWTWALYALLQLTSANWSSRGELARGNVVSLLKTPPPGLPDHGVQYLEQLLTTLLA